MAGFLTQSVALACSLRLQTVLKICGAYGPSECQHDGLLLAAVSHLLTALLNVGLGKFGFFGLEL